MTIDKSEFEKFADELARQYPAYAISSAKIGMGEMLSYHMEHVPEYPVETLEPLMPPDGVSFLRTDKQRAWFFAAVQAGELPGWVWVEAKYGTSNVRVYSNHSTSYLLKGEQRDEKGAYTLEERKTIIEPAHPEKIGGARTGNLGRAQTQQVESSDEDVTGYIGFDEAIAPYAPWVVGDDFPGTVIGGENMYQARVHVDRWWQFGVIIENNLESGWAVFNESFWEEFSRKVNNAE